VKFFWQGFRRGRQAPLKFKRHIIVLYWSPNDPTALSHKNRFVKTALSHPSVLVKIVNIEKDPLRSLKHQITTLPTIILMRNGKEVMRSPHPNQTVIEQFFRKAII
jgi:hypothetical protein